MNDWLSGAERIVSPGLRRFLRRRYRMLAADHDDLVQDTLEHLVRYLGAHSSKPPPADQWPPIAMTILQRRIADRFRATAKHAITEIDQLEEDDARLIDPSAGTEEIVRHRRLLSRVLLLISEMPAEDQALLLADSSTADIHDPVLSATDRKKLSRLRRRLRDHLKSRFGVLPEDFFER